jgi:hypothetical protein
MMSAGRLRRSRAARDSSARLSRKAREHPGAWWWGPHAGVKRARAFAGSQTDRRRHLRRQTRIIVVPFFVLSRRECEHGQPGNAAE